MEGVKQSNASTRTPVSPGTTLLVIGLLLALFVVTGLVISSYRREKRDRSARHFELGLQYQRDGEHDEAIEHLREALVFNESEDYGLALVESLMDARRYSEAEAYLTQILEKDPTSGIANLLMARISAAVGEGRRAQSYYSRAIFGRWSAGEQQNRLEARFELAEYLLRSGNGDGALSELLDMRNEVASDHAQLERLGELFLQAGAANYARTAFQSVVVEDAENVPALEGLAKAELGVGNFLAARNAAQAVLRLKPDDAAAARVLKVAQTVVNLDPLARNLSGTERYRRSVELVRLGLDRLRQCVSEASRDSALQELETLAQGVVSAKKRERPGIDAAEANIETAQRVWSAVKERCGASEEDRAMEVLLTRLKER